MLLRAKNSDDIAAEKTSPPRICQFDILGGFNVDLIRFFFDSMDFVKIQQNDKFYTNNIVRKRFGQISQSVQKCIDSINNIEYNIYTSYII